MSGGTTVAGDNASFVGTGICEGSFLGFGQAAQAVQISMNESGNFAAVSGSRRPIAIVAHGTGSMNLYRAATGGYPCPFISFSVHQLNRSFSLHGSAGGQAFGSTSASGGTTNFRFSTLSTLKSPENDCEADALAAGAGG